MQDIKDWVKNCEGLKLHMYQDTTDHPTIGWGRNLDNGLSIDEAQLLFDNDFNRTVKELESQDWYNRQPVTVKNALINMNFNLGISKLLEFKNMITALKQGEYANAAREALNSLWAEQVGQRAKDVAVMISEGRNSV
jgi:lysozyme